MSLYERIVNKEEKISLVGLGYVGMPIAVAFAKKVNVIGFDLNKAKIDAAFTAEEWSALIATKPNWTFAYL